jgi:acetylornithine deacetylase
MRREGVSALANLQVLVAALEADEARRNGAETDPLMTAIGLPYPTIVGKVSGGVWASSVMDQVVAEGRYGVRLGQTPGEAGDELRECISAACAADPFLREHPATLEVFGAAFDTSRVAPDHVLPVTLAAAAAAVTGRTPALVGVPYGCDMRLFVGVGQTPCVVFGPGDVRLAHAADERVPLAEVEACARVLAAWVVESMGA